MKKLIIGTIIALVGLTLCILLVYYYKENSKKDSNLIIDNDMTNPLVDGNEQELQGNRKLTVWAVYWDSNILNEISKMKSSIYELCYFAAYFDSNNKPFIPNETRDTKNEITFNFDVDAISYLTFVNDRRNLDGSASLKDTDLLYRLLSSNEDRSNHIKDLIKLTINGDYDGIEIDYEGIKKDETLWGYFILFVKELYEEAKNHNLLLRVLLEPGVELKSLEFPSSPTYVMMCYNLYGYGTEPGPKANGEFLLQMVDKMKHFPGKVGFAIATGGFDFDENGTVSQLTKAKAQRLKNQYNALEYRDEESMSLYFKYKDINQIKHEVWYADDTTLDYWFSIIEEAGDYNLSLWRVESSN